MDRDDWVYGGVVVLLAGGVAGFVLLYLWLVNWQIVGPVG